MVLLIGNIFMFYYFIYLLSLIFYIFYENWLLNVLIIYVKLIIIWSYCSYDYVRFKFGILVYM